VHGLHLAAGLVVLGGLNLDSCGQTANALIDKLVEKGSLTVKAAKELREEADKGFTWAHQLKTGLPGWVSSLKWSGDLRGRYEGFTSDNSAAVDRHRFQYRLRLGMTVSMLDSLELGVRLASAADQSSDKRISTPLRRVSGRPCARQRLEWVRVSAASVAPPRFRRLDRARRLDLRRRRKAAMNRPHAKRSRAPWRGCTL
jgi:hypothetical protein